MSFLPLYSTLPYVTMAVFLLGMTWRISHWLKGAKTEIRPFLVASPKPGIWKDALAEICVFRSLFKTDRKLWASTWVLHVCIVLLLAGHLRAVVELGFLIDLFRMDPAGFSRAADLAGKAVGVVVGTAALCLLARRLLAPAVREISTIEDYLVLVLLLLVVLSGLALRFAAEFDLNASRAYFRAILSLEPAAVPRHPLFLLHFVLGQVLVMTIPFTKFMHMPGVFISKSLVFLK